jgi:hypothetical protein
MRVTCISFNDAYRPIFRVKMMRMFLLAVAISAIFIRCRVVVPSGRLIGGCSASYDKTHLCVRLSETVT